MRLLENVRLRDFTTLGVGGPARYFVEAASEDDVVRGEAFASTRNLPLFVLGGGSNVLVADEGFGGVVLCVRLLGTDLRGADPASSAPAAGSRVTVSAAAGEGWDEFVASCVEGDLVGVECLSGIPGTVGGTPIQNVGAYGQDVSETVASVRVLDRARSIIRDLAPGDCGFGYRTSAFNTSEKGRYIVLRVAFSLAPGAAPALRHDQLRARFADRPPTLRAVRDAVREIRRGKGMLLVAGDPDSRSAGSFFKNPVVSEETYQALRSAAGPDMPAYPAGPARLKIPAAWLVERAGYGRGMTLGQAGLSTRHSLALVNRGHATARELLELARAIRGSVRERFGVVLEPEPVLLGFDRPLDD